MTALPIDFIKSVGKMVPENETDDFIKALETNPPVSIRYNPFKTPEQPATGYPVPWCKDAQYLTERPIFTLDPLFHAGSYYVGEASSMFLETCFNHIKKQLPLKPKILDLCAAPGGKSTHIAALAGDEALLVANEVIRSRANILSENTKKWGLGNTVVTNNDPARFASIPHFFDLMLADVPCSGEGMFRKQPSAREEWSLNHVELCAARQQRILADVWDTLRPGGFLIYSTCTFNTLENEENVRWIAETLGAEVLSPEIPEEWGITKTEVKGGTAFRFFPHKIQGEGLFMALLQKKGSEHSEQRSAAKKGSRKLLNPIPKKERNAINIWWEKPEQWDFFAYNNQVVGCKTGWEPDMEQLMKHLNIIYFGTEAGQLIRGELKPEHALALSPNLSKTVVPIAHLSLDEAQNFLRKQPLPPELFEPGLNLVCFQGTPVGWAKRIAARINNLYPKEYRIQHL